MTFHLYAEMTSPRSWMLFIYFSSALVMSQPRADIALCKIELSIVSFVEIPLTNIIFSENVNF